MAKERPPLRQHERAVPRADALLRTKRLEKLSHDLGRNNPLIVYDVFRKSPRDEVQAMVAMDDLHVVHANVYA